MFDLLALDAPFTAYMDVLFRNKLSAIQPSSGALTMAAISFLAILERSRRGSQKDIADSV